MELGCGPNLKMECTMLKQLRQWSTDAFQAGSTAQLNELPHEIDWKFVFLWRLKPLHPPSMI